MRSKKTKKTESGKLVPAKEKPAHLGVEVPEEWREFVNQFCLEKRIRQSVFIRKCLIFGLANWEIIKKTSDLQ